MFVFFNEMFSPFSKASLRKQSVYIPGISVVRGFSFVGSKIYAGSRDPARMWNHRVLNSEVSRISCSKELRLSLKLSVYGSVIMLALPVQKHQASGVPRD